MPSAVTQSITSLGHELSTAPDAFGWLTPSEDLIDRPKDLRERLAEDGYLYLRNYLDRDLINAARMRLLEQLDELGMVNRDFDIDEGIAASPWQRRSCHDLVASNAPLLKLLYTGRMIEAYERIFDRAVRHFDFTWLRVMGPGKGTAPHADSVYMNRGTVNLFTSWVPLSDVPLDVGGLTIMPGTHRVQKLVDNYCSRDVDAVCTNTKNRAPMDTHGWVGPVGDGKLTENPPAIQKTLNKPWLTSEHWQRGDVVIFHIHTVHGSLDNHTNKIRLSTDARYQPADEPADERWVGANPIGHGKQARRGMIC